MLRRHLAEMDDAAGDVDSYYPLNLAFHDCIVSSAGNATLAAEYTSFVKRMHLFRAWNLSHGGLAVSNQEHREIVEAVASGDPDRAFAACWRHVDRAKERLVASPESEIGRPSCRERVCQYV